MKKILLLASAAIMAAGAMQAKTAEELRIYLNPGHGSWGPNDRPMATIPYPSLPETGRPDTCGFYESNTNLWKILKMGQVLENLGVKHENIMYSRVKNGPYPYVADAADKEIYNRNLSEICREVDANNMDMFISIHSNAASDGTTTNYPLFLYRGKDGKGNEGNAGSWDMCDKAWDGHYMDAIDPQSHYSRTSKNLRGDVSFYGTSYTTTTSKGTFEGYLGALRHGTPGYLAEGYFHTYQPARHRALNPDYCGMEGVGYARGVAEYFGIAGETTGYIMGTVKDLHEKIVNSLYKYAVNTDDQYLPLNGAVVTLKKNGQVVATYTCDQKWNGVFVFEGLEPGNYTLSASCEGYKDIFEEEAITVAANATSYAKLHLENLNYVPEEVVYHNYPDPVQPSYLKLASQFNFSQDNGTAFEMTGEVKRSITRGDSTVVLTNTPALYLINNKTMTLIKEISLNGIEAVDTENAGYYSNLSDIAFTADGQLVGVNNIRCQYSDGQVDEGYKRGTVKFYKWASFDEDPQLWVSTQSSANFYRADMGATLAVSGPAKDCEVVTTGVTSGDSKAIHFLVLNVNENEIVASRFTEKTLSATGTFTLHKQGEDIQLNVSPLNDHRYILNGSLCAPFEFEPAAVQNTDSEVTGTFDADEIGLTSKGLAFFKYAKRALMAAPVLRSYSHVVEAINLYDITDGLQNAVLVKTVGTNLAPIPMAPAKKAPSMQSTFNAAGANVNGADINLFVAGDKNIVKFATAGVEQPLFRGHYAYDLNFSETGDTYTFKFKSTGAAEQAVIILSKTEGPSQTEEPIYLPISVVKGDNELTVNKADYEGQYFWKVGLLNDAIPSINSIFHYAPQGNGSYCSRGMTIDRNQTSPFFQNMYISNPYGSVKGIYEVNPALEVVNDGAPYLQNEWVAGNSASPFRLGINPNNGFVWAADWCDPHGGIFIMDPANPTTAIPFFVGTRASSGQITNAEGTVIGGSSTNATFLGTGADTKLISFQEDLPKPTTGVKLCAYNIGTALTTDKAPDMIFDNVSAKLGNGNVEVIALEEGMFVSQIRGSGNNTAGVPGFVFADYEDNILFSSHTLDDLDGTYGAGMALSDDKSMLAICTGKPYINIYAVEWANNVPSFKLQYTIDQFTGAGSILNQMHFDHAGNLFVADAKTGIHGITIPKDQQPVYTASNYIFNAEQPTSVDDVNSAKTVAGVKYYNTLGVASSTPFEGLNIVVTTYTDGTQSSAKVIK
ncbi:MAG: carboxypeptidase-like regulatory domain-containing protein [Bacteroidales bacterium]|nr:carboxypeptidase-like regulatory domain-containing protein [Bacteroidales bacterium]